METVDKNAACPCGSTKKYKHCCQRKEQQAAQLRQQQLRVVPARLELGMQALRSNNLAHAQLLFEQVLQLVPDQPDAMHWLSVISFQQGATDEALDRIGRLVNSHPGSAQFQASQANMFKELGQYQEAIAAYERSLKLKPDAPDVLNNYGTVLAIGLNYSEAETNYRKAIAMAPTYAEAYSNLAVSLEVRGLEGEAKAHFEAALRLNPNHAHALAGRSRLEQDNHVLAIQLVEKALGINPKIGLWWMHLARLESSQGNIEKAKAAIQRGLAVEDFPELRLFDATLLPSIMGTQEEVLASRIELEEKLKKLLQDKVKYRANFTQYVSNNFYMAYHGQNDRKLQMLLADLHLQALPQLAYFAPHCRLPIPLTGKRRVGFVSLYARASHSVGASFAGILNAVASDERFDVTLITGESLTDDQMDDAYPALKRQRVLLPHNLLLAQQMIASLELDVLVYLDIGMNPETYSLAFARLARVQCVLGGHPVTTGIPAMDYFLSADSIELPEAQEHYSESLVRMRHGAFYFRRPQLPQFNKSRGELGLPTQGHIYLCPMTLFKLHPDFDTAVEAILRADPLGTVLFVKTPGRSKYDELLGKRFDRTIDPAVRSRVRFIPWISDKADFMRVLETSDVILDPFHFGIGTTAIWTTALGTPFVTLPSDYMRGRVGMFYCKIMGLQAECVAVDRNDYVKKAVEFAVNPEWRSQVKARILKASGVFYENHEGIEDVKSFLATCSVPAMN